MVMVENQKHFITTDRADFIMEYLIKNIPWKKFAPSPNSRLVSIVDHDRDPVLKELVFELTKQKGVSVKDVFLNYYQNGIDYCPYHRDQYGTDVYTLSLGDTRDFLVKPDGTGTKATKYTLNSGDLYFMPESLHKTHRHSIPKRKNQTKP